MLYLYLRKINLFRLSFYIFSGASEAVLFTSFFLFTPSKDFIVGTKAPHISYPLTEYYNRLFLTVCINR